MKKLLTHGVLALVAGHALAAPILDGPVPESVPRPPAEPLPETWRFKTDLSQPMTGDYDVRKLMAGKSPWLKNRISRCFFGPIKRPPYYRDELMDDVDYYPEAYLDRLAREGVNGLWLTVEFGDFAKEVTGDWPENAERRIGKLRQTVARCGKYGIKVWLFCIEPIEQDFRKSPLALKHPEWLGSTYDDLMSTMCASHPDVQKYIRDTVRDIFTAVPGLGGIINISNGEKVTSCLSVADIENHPCLTKCARCRNVPLAELLHRVERPMVEGMRAAGSDANLISWIYRGANPLLPEWVVEAARTQPDGVIQQNNFETGVLLKQEGYWHLGPDYWISCSGPSMAFAQVARAAHGSGKRISAKIQLSCSHEIATIPVLPVPGLLYRKFKGMHDLGVTDAMYCWYFGSAPGLMNRAAGLLAYDDFTDGEEAFLARLAESEWGEDAERMAKVWKACSDGFANYPLSNPVQYYGPYHQGVVWPLRPDIEMRPLGDSWIPAQPAGGDLVGECLSEFSLREVLALAKKMCAPIDAVEDDIVYLERKYADDPERRKEIGLVRALQCHLAAGRDIFEFYHARRDAVALSRVGNTTEALLAIGRMKAVVRNELPLTRRMKALCLDDSRLGFHSEAESYLYHPEYFDWRVPTLEKSLARLEEIEAEIRAGRGYPLSPLEKAAPVFPASFDANGDLILEGEAKGEGRITLWLYDACGTQRVRKYEVDPQDGHFRIAVPALDWDNDPRLRPGWIQIHQNCTYREGLHGWTWPEHPAFAWRWTQGDLLGFYSARIEVSPSAVACCAAKEPKISMFADAIEREAREMGTGVAEAARKFYDAGVHGFDAYYGDTNLPVLVSGPMKPASFYGWVDFSAPDGGRAVSDAFVAAAVKYGVPRIMVIPNSFTKGGDREAEFRVTVEGLRRLAKAARAMGITPMVEDFGDETNPCSSSEFLKRYLDEIPELSYALDSGNLHYAGRGEDILEMLRFAKGRIAHVHLKDFAKGSNRIRATVGLGDIPNEEIVRTVKADGYDEWITLEDLVGERLDDACRQVGVVRHWWK